MDKKSVMNSRDIIKVSVIVPIYNAGNRIYRCLDTLVNQTLKEIEIICVLDCPTDGTDKVVEEYANNDDRIIIVRNKSNLHVSGSRNEGLKVARGEYIGFSDHDDYRELDMYEKLYEKACQQGADVVVSDVKVINEDRTVEHYCFDDFSKKTLIDSVILPFEDKRNINKIFKACWLSIYKKQFIIENAIRFEDRRSYHEEDVLFNLKVALFAKRFSYVKEEFYCWDKHVESESNRLVAHEEVASRQLNSFVYIANLLKNKYCFSDFKESFYITLSDSINKYYLQYKSFLGEEKKKFVSLIQMVHFPLFGRYNLKPISKKRLKLFSFVLKLKLEGIKARHILL